MTPRPLYHPGDPVCVRLIIGSRRGEGIRRITEVLVADSRGWFYLLDAPVDVDGIPIEKVYEDELQSHF